MHSLSDAPLQPRVPGGCPRTSRACILVYILYFTAETHHLPICFASQTRIYTERQAAPQPGLVSASSDQRSRSGRGTQRGRRRAGAACPSVSPPPVSAAKLSSNSRGRGAVRHGRPRHRNLGSGGCGRIIVAPLGGAPDGLAPIATRGPGPPAVDVGRIPHPVGRPTPRVARRSGPLRRRRRHALAEVAPLTLSRPAASDTSSVRRDLEEELMAVAADSRPP